ncbi:MAG: phosphoenolpyruvate-utilizing N-terminal domain-containing protein, partial [Myxococcota bacterium]
MMTPAPRPPGRGKSRPERIRGMGVAGGIGLGHVHVLNRRLDSVPHHHIKPDEVQKEKARLQRAVEASIRHFDEARARFQSRDLSKLTDIMEAYRLMIADPSLVKGASALIEREQINAEWALEREALRFRAIFEEADDAYLAERSSDLDRIASGIMRNLLGVGEPPPIDQSRKVVVVAHDLLPADIFSLPRNGVCAFVTDVGGPASHTAILARSMGIPAVIGAEGVSERAVQGQEIIVDGIHGDVWLNADGETRNRLVAIGERYRSLMASLSSESTAGAGTADGTRITLMANIELTDEVASAIRHGAEGVGLLRTEYLFVNRRRPPSEEEHFRTYRQVAERFAPSPVTIRTLDVGG